MSDDAIHWEWDAEHSLAKAIRNKAIEECARAIETSTEPLGHSCRTMAAAVLRKLKDKTT